MTAATLAPAASGVNVGRIAAAKTAARTIVLLLALVGAADLAGVGEVTVTGRGGGQPATVVQDATSQQPSDGGKAERAKREAAPGKE